MRRGECRGVARLSDMVHVCSVCPKTFGSQRAAEQHCRDVHGKACPKCGKHFTSRSAATQHFRDVHSRDEEDFDEEDSSSDDDAPPPPFPAAYGAWVSAGEFTRGKSFGMFECRRCSNTWMSAHAQAKFRQGCVRCETMTRPFLMWENWERRTSTDKEREDDTKPHHRSRCEGCRAGMCI